MTGHGKCSNCGYQFKSWVRKCPQCGTATGIKNDIEKGEDKEVIKAGDIIGRIIAVFTFFCFCFIDWEVWRYFLSHKVIAEKYPNFLLNLFSVIIGLVSASLIFLITTVSVSVFGRFLYLALKKR